METSAKLSNGCSRTQRTEAGTVRTTHAPSSSNGCPTPPLQTRHHLRAAAAGSSTPAMLCHEKLSILQHKPALLKIQCISSRFPTAAMLLLITQSLLTRF